MEVKDEILALRRQLDHHNYMYYVMNSPEIDDFEFDRMLRRLQDLESAHPEYYDSLSPTQRVGCDITSEFQSVRHAFPMLSLSNTYSLEELREFVQKVISEIGSVEFCCELKFDGTAISLTYENGRLLRAVTRGDGERGDDVTANVKTIKSVPLILSGEDYPDFFEIRGEILMPYASFDRVNAERMENDEPLFANPRNAAAGTLKQQQSKVVAKRGLDCTLYQFSATKIPYKSHYATLEKAREWGFKISKHMRLCSTMEEIEAFINYWDTERKALPFPTDGVVIKVNDYQKRSLLGTTAKSPRWAVAYKFKAEVALTKIESISFQVGRTGAVTPVANLTPVLLAGTTVKRATLHNAEQIKLLDIRIGDMVYVEKGGEIIPKITGVEKSMRSNNSTTFCFIERCPECGTPLVRYEGEAKHFCPNQSHCRPQILGRIIHFIQRKAMNIEGLGSETVEMLFENGLLKNIADLYSLKAQDLATLPRLGEKSAANIIQSINSSCEVPFRRVLFGLGIRFVGETTAKYLASHFRNIDSLMAASKEELCMSDEVGEKIAESITDYLQDQTNKDIIQRLRTAGLQFVNSSQAISSNILQAKNIVVSGKYNIVSREDMKALIEKNGGRNQSSVNSSTSMIVAGENMGPEKLKKAEKLGIEIVSEKDFLSMIGFSGQITNVEEEVKTKKEQPQQLTLF
ncbi:MAG: NAD-dependent DNA ligase LigA [Alistipes sp.]|nr:NAD-dependent DNA ligase LigA [Candidatus Alistipes equi]